MEWPRVPISEIYEGLYDGPHATPKPSDTGPIFLGIKNITVDGRLNLSDIRHIAEEEFPNWTKRVTPQAGDIVFTYEATLNRYAIIPNGFRGCLGRRMALIRPKLEKVDVRFLHYSFFGEEWRRIISSNILIGSTVDRIPLTNFPKFPICLPPLRIQHRIASILSAYDDLIENNEQRIKILEEMAQNLYREWFVKFRFPGHKKVKMVDSPLGKIPEGWGVVKLENLIEIHRGHSYKSTELVQGQRGLPFLNLKCINRDGGYRSEGLKRYEGPYKEHQEAKPGDIIVAVTDMTQERRIVARAARVPTGHEKKYVFSMDLVKLSPKKDLSSEFLYGFLRYSSFSEITKEFANGVNVLHLNPKHIGEFELALPYTQIIKDFSDTYKSILLESDILQIKSYKLRQTRDLLLPRLISGELDVSELDIEVPEDATGDRRPVKKKRIIPTPTEHEPEKEKRSPDIEDYEVDEIMAVFRQVGRGRGTMTRDELIKAVSEHLGYRRLGSKMRNVLKGHLRAAVRRNIIGVDGNDVWLATPRAEDYEREDLIDTILSVMRKSRQYDREDVIYNVASHLGFSRVKETVRAPIKSAINGAIRRGILDYEVDVIRRTD